MNALANGHVDAVASERLEGDLGGALQVVGRASLYLAIEDQFLRGASAQ